MPDSQDDILAALSAAIRRKLRQAETETATEETQVSPVKKNVAGTKSPLEVQKERILDTLAELGEVNVGDDALTFEGTKFVLPQLMEGNLPGAAQYLMDYQRQQETQFDFTRTYPYRPWDGAAAFDRAMKKVFGTSGIGKVTETFFGDIKPEYRTVATGPNSTIQVPQGRVGFSPLDATFTVTGTRSREKGLIFALGVEAPRKYRAHIDAFFQVVEQELREHSIYRGKAFTGADEPEFLDTSDIDPAKVVYSEDVMTQLDTHMWSLLRHSQAMREHNIPLRRAILLEGPYGTGKSLAGRLTAREAVNNDWTFIICRPGKDDLGTTLKTAEMYSPAVVWFEDIDVVAKGSSDGQISALLDSLDGITNKGVEVVAGFTTNFVDRIQKGVLRPGRLDAVIHIAELDDAGTEKLIRATLPQNLQGVIDYAEVCPAFRGLLPAFAKEATDRSIRYAIARGEGTPSPITTADLVNAANGLRPQLKLMEEAQEGVKVVSLEQAFNDVVRGVVDGTKVLDEDGDDRGKLKTN